MRKILGGGLVPLGFVSTLIFGFWGLILDLRILNAIGGFWLVLAGLFIFPAMFTLAPLYAAFSWGDWRPLAVTIAGGLMLMLFAGVGAAVFSTGAKQTETMSWSSIRWYFSKTWWFPVRALLFAWFVYALIVSVLSSPMKVMAAATVIMAVSIAKSFVLGVIASTLLFPVAIALALCAIGLYAWPLVAVPRVWQGGRTLGWKLPASFALIVGGALVATAANWALGAGIAWVADLEPCAALNAGVTGSKPPPAGACQPLAIPASGEPRSFKCEQPLPEFTLGATSNPSDAEVAKLCACVWSKLPEGGWERDVSAKIRRGEDPGWRQSGFIPRFGAALDACGGRSL